jgi:hypothetical protein
MSANKMLEMEIRAAYIFLREKNHTIPSDTLQFMLDASLEKLNSVEYNEVLDPVSKPLQADIRNKLSPLSNLIAMLEDGADDEWLEKQVVECKKSIEYLSNVC